MKNKKQDMDSRNKKEGNQEDLDNQNEKRQNTEHFLSKKGSNKLKEEVANRKNEDKEKDLYEEDNRGIDKKLSKEDVRNSEPNQSSK